MIICMSKTLNELMVANTGIIRLFIVAKLLLASYERNQCNVSCRTVSLCYSIEIINNYRIKIV